MSLVLQNISSCALHVFYIKIILEVLFLVLLLPLKDRLKVCFILSPMFEVCLYFFFLMDCNLKWIFMIFILALCLHDLSTSVCVSLFYLLQNIYVGLF
jgi:hypothetical protein